MFFKKKLPILLCLVIAFLFITGFVIYMLNCSSPNEYFIFENINECERLILTDQSDLIIDRYASPEKDENIKELSYESFFGMKFHSNELEYEIFAYEFVDSDSALRYYINVTGQRSYEKELPLRDDDENKRLLSSKGMSSYKLIAVYQRKAYVIVAPKQYEEVINKLLANTFSYQLS